MRIGIGYDSHRFVDGRPLILGGVTIPHAQGLAGHSDADAICHALTDALLGAAALGDIGTHFPDSDPRWKDADSIELLRSTAGLLADAGWRPMQCDLTVIAEAPRLGPHTEQIRNSIAAAISVDPSAVGCKAKSNEGMGFIGRGEGIAVIAVATIESRR